MLLERIERRGRAGAPLRPDGYFRMTFEGRGGGARALTAVSGGDPAYGESPKMFAEAALCLAHDDLPERAGQLTAAVAMGEALIARLQHIGIAFEVLSVPGGS
ncbi:MAG TPA: saccharopine dehydrogenase, partial [Solirubrobacteraceae bacterium]